MSLETDQNSDSGAKPSVTKPHSRQTFSAHRLFSEGLPALIADTAACVRFFSRLPLSKINAFDDPAAPPKFGQIARTAPLAGVVIALPAAGFGMFLGFTSLPTLAVATLTVGLLAATTGALHEDGLGDVADGFFGGATREKRLDIMKDSRIGAFGALAMVISVVLRISLLAVLWQRFSPADAALLFLSVEAVSRTLVVWQWQQRPLARPGGLAARFGKPDTRTLAGAALLTLPLLVPAALLLSLPALLLGGFVALCAAYGVGRLSTEKIGGVTGDVLGAIQQISGLGFLIGMLMVP